MPPTVTRELSITYGGITVGGTSAIYLLTDRHKIEMDYAESAISFRVLVVGSSASDLATNANALEAEFREPLQALTVTMGGATMLSFSHSASTGFNAVPSIAKVGDDGDTGRSREYDCRVVVQRPADLSGYSGRRWQDTKISVTTEANGHTILTISGAYTAIGATGARAQYAASIEAYVAAVQVSIFPTGYTWDKVNEVAETDDTDKVCTFSRTYEPVGTGDGEPPDLDKWSITISREYDGSGDSFDDSARAASRLIGYHVHVSGLGNVSALMSGWRSTRSWAIARLRRLYSPGTLALLSESFVPDVKSGAVTADLAFVGLSGGGDLITWTRTVTSTPDSGWDIRPVWQTPYSVHVFQGPATSTREVTDTERYAGDVRTVARLDAAAPANDPLPRPGKQWLRILPPRITETPLKLGTLEFTMPVVDRVTSWVERYVDVITAPRTITTG